MLRIQPDRHALPSVRECNANTRPVYENHHACPAYVFEYRCPSLHGANPYGTNLKPANAPGCLLRMEKAPMFFNAGSSTALTARRIYLDMYSYTNKYIYIYI